MLVFKLKVVLGLDGKESAVVGVVVVVVVNVVTFSGILEVLVSVIWYTL